MKHSQPKTILDTLSFDNEVSIINPDSTFTFVRKKARGASDNFDYIEEFKNSGRDMKSLLRVTGEVMESLSMLKMSFPNFEPVIEFIENSLKLKMLGNKTLRFEPVFIHGKPGIGKTEFVYELSKSLKVVLEKFNASTLSGNFSLAGSESQWADSSPGLVVKAMLKSSHANFIFYLDEIEKAAVGGNAGHPLSALFDLLEDHSSKRFVDMAFGDSVLFDCSNINFIATGNSLDGVHPAIISRFNVFDIEMPDSEQMVEIVRNIHAKLIAENDWGNHFDKELSIEAVNALTQKGSIRDVKKVLKNAYISANQAGRRGIEPIDIDMPDDFERRIGFY